MNNSSPPSKSDLIQEELTAYLDGELGDADAARVEQLLADDAAYRRQLQHLQQAWDMLDELPRSEVSESFTRSTVEMVALTAAGDVNKMKSAAAGRKLVSWLGGIAAAAAAALIGYSLVSSRVSAPNDELVRDLPVIENIDLYRNAEDVDFVLELYNAGLFVEDSDDAI